MKIPAALHPANHFHVQCLLLHAGLCADGGLAPQHGRREVYHLARALALSRVALEDGLLESPQRRPSTQQLPADPPLQQQQRRPHSTPVKPVKPMSVWQWCAAEQLVRGMSDHLQTMPPPAPNIAAHEGGAGSPLTTAAAVRALAFMTPRRLVPLYAPRTLLPPIPLFPYHSHVTYDAAVHHVSLLSNLLQPYGFTVSLTGGVRRGSPAAPHADVLLSLTEEATREVEAVLEMRATDTKSLSQHDTEVESDGGGECGEEKERGTGSVVVEGGDRKSTATTLPLSQQIRSKRRAGPRPPCDAVAPARKAATFFHRDSLTVPMATITSSSSSSSSPYACRVSSAAAAGAPPLPCGSHLVSQHISTDLCQDDVCTFSAQGRKGSGRRRRRQQCRRENAFAASDVVSPQVAHRTQRAVQHLIRQGYIVAGHIPSLSPFFLSQRQPLCVSVRYDTCCPALVPPVECTDPVVLARLELHQLRLHFCPWQARPTRQLFITGPPAFAAHVALRALAHGVDLNMNGTFECIAVQPPTHSSCDNEGATAPAAPAASGGNATSRGMRAAATASDSALAAAAAARTDSHVAETASQLRRDFVYQHILDDESDIFALAGMPVIDPLLRGAYCQLHGLA
jgi:hypothetical protein